MHYLDNITSKSDLICLVGLLSIYRHNIWGIKWPTDNVFFNLDINERLIQICLSHWHLHEKVDTMGDWKNP